MRNGIVLEDIVFTPYKHRNPFLSISETSIQTQKNSNSKYVDSRRFGHCTVVLDGLVIMYGGRTRAGEFDPKAKYLSPRTFEWMNFNISEGSAEILRSYGSCTVHNNRAWICGGNEGERGSQGRGTPVDSCMSFG